MNYNISEGDRPDQSGDQVDNVIYPVVENRQLYEKLKFINCL